MGSSDRLRNTGGRPSSRHEWEPGSIAFPRTPWAEEVPIAMMSVAIGLADSMMLTSVAPWSFWLALYSRALVALAATVAPVHESFVAFARSIDSNPNPGRRSIRWATGWFAMSTRHYDSARWYFAAPFPCFPVAIGEALLSIRDLFQSTDGASGCLATLTVDCEFASWRFAAPGCFALACAGQGTASLRSSCPFHCAFHKPFR